jgi:hypothetical protein
LRYTHSRRVSLAPKINNQQYADELEVVFVIITFGLMTLRGLPADTFTAQVKANSTIPGGDFEHSVFLVPRRTLVFEKILEEEGVLGDLTIGEYSLYFIPLEPDLLSLEFDSSFEELYLVCGPHLMG